MTDPITIDCDYLGPRIAASYLLVEGREAAFIETNTTPAVPRLLEALRKTGLERADVRYVIITHVHLDHAGGASALMQACPNATLLAHPRAAPHVIDPSRLVASARKVYGDETFDRLYGRIDPIPAERVRSMGDNETLTWGTRTLSFLHTRGHANHHMCIHDASSGAVFTGDSFGLCYPALQTHGLFMLPSTSPTDFDPEEAKKSVDRIATLAQSVYPTHFGQVTEVKAAARQLHELLDFSADLLGRAVAMPGTDEEITRFCRRELQDRYTQAMRRAGLEAQETHWQLLELDLALNAQGIAYAAAKRREKARGGSP